MMLLFTCMLKIGNLGAILGQRYLLSIRQWLADEFIEQLRPSRQFNHLAGMNILQVDFQLVIYPFYFDDE